MEDAMTARPPAVPFETILGVVISHYNSLVRSFSFVKMLPSERDVNYLLETEWVSGIFNEDYTRRTIFKISNGTDDRKLIEAQTETMLYCRKAGCPVQTVYDPAYLEIQLNGRCYIARLFSYIEGDLISSLSRESNGALFTSSWKAAGECAGAVSACLRRYMRELALADREKHAYLSCLESSVDWNLCNVQKVVGEYLLHFPEGDPVYSSRRKIVQRMLQEFVEKYPGSADGLLKALAHNDPNDNNIVVRDTEHGPIVSLLDWGDLSYSYALADVAIGAAYINDDEARALFTNAWLSVQSDVLAEVVDSNGGAAGAVEQTAREAIEDLTKMRRITSVSLSNYQEQRLLKQGVSKDDSEFQYLLVSQTQMWEVLQ